jgi:predicted transcriptional regulator
MKNEKKEIRMEVNDEFTSAMEFVKAWHLAIKGRPVEPIERICFLDIKSMTHTLTNRRLELLNVLRKNGPTSIRSIAKKIKRDYKNVYSDVKSLKLIGLIEADDKELIRVPWDRIAAEIPLAA